MEGLDRDKESYEADVAKVRADLGDLGRLRDEDVSAKAADIIERDIVPARYDEEVQVYEGARAERYGF